MSRGRFKFEFESRRFDLPAEETRRVNRENARNRIGNRSDVVHYCPTGTGNDHVCDAMLYPHHNRTCDETQVTCHQCAAIIIVSATLWHLFGERTHSETLGTLGPYRFKSRNVKLVGPADTFDWRD